MIETPSRLTGTVVNTAKTRMGKDAAMTMMNTLKL
jgi:hypothetical protein